MDGGLMSVGLPGWLLEGGAAEEVSSRHGWAGPSHWQYHAALARSRGAPEQKATGKAVRYDCSSDRAPHLMQQ